MTEDPAIALLRTCARLLGVGATTAAGLAARLGLTREGSGVWEGVPPRGGAERVRVVARPDGRPDYVLLELAPGPDALGRSALIAALGPATDVPRIPGPRWSTVAFPPLRGLASVTLLARLDDATDTACALVARRDD